MLKEKHRSSLLFIVQNGNHMLNKLTPYTHNLKTESPTEQSNNCDKLEPLSHEIPVKLCDPFSIAWFICKSYERRVAEVINCNQL